MGLNLRRRLAWACWVALAGPCAQAAGHVLTVGTPGASAPGVVVSTPAGIDCGPQCQFAFPQGTQVELAVTAPPGKAFAGFSSAPYVEDSCVRGSCRILMTTQKEASALFTDLRASPTPFVWFTTLPFPNTSVNTTEVAKAYLVNAGQGPLAVTGLSTNDSRFVPAADCGTLATGAGCDISVAFTPSVEGALQRTVTISTDQGTVQISVSGVAERTLIPHFYQAILRRQPDSGGKAFWANEAGRLAAPIRNEDPTPRADLDEVWFAMATMFYGSPEYAAFGRDGAGFVADLYDTFFNRAPDSSGLAYWGDQLAAGLPREVALASFMFSAEFAAFNTAIFGGDRVRAEVDMVMDFYRGLLGRLPDTAGLDYWVGRFRAAQCAGPQAVRAEVETIASAFALSAEYAARARTTVQYVGDLYSAFLRRGGDLQGVQYWIDQVATGARSREQVRVAFRDSPEFSARVEAVVAAGCKT